MSQTGKLLPPHDSSRWPVPVSKVAPREPVFRLLANVWAAVVAQ